MLNPYYGLFQYSRDDIYTLQINPDSAVNPVGLGPCAANQGFLTRNQTHTWTGFSTWEPNSDNWYCWTLNLYNYMIVCFFVLWSKEPLKCVFNFLSDVYLWFLWEKFSLFWLLLVKLLDWKWNAQCAMHENKTKPLHRVWAWAFLLLWVLKCCLMLSSGGLA